MAYLRDDVLEVRLSPRLRGMRHHGEHCVVELLVFVVQEDELRPEVGLLRCAQDFWNVDSRPEEKALVK